MPLRVYIAILACVIALGGLTVWIFAEVNHSLPLVLLMCAAAGLGWLRLSRR